MTFGDEAHEPVEEVEEAVAAEGDKVEAIQHGWDGRLAQEEELGEDGEGFEDDAEGPEDLLRHQVSGLMRACLK